MAEVSETPSQVEMETLPDKKSIKIEMAEVEEVEGPAATFLPVTAKLAHILAILVSGVIAVAVSTVLADGSSVIKLVEATHLPVITARNLEDKGPGHYKFRYRLDQLLGPTYGVGLHHDQSGHNWYTMSAGSTAKQLIADLGLPVVLGAVTSVIATDDLKHPVPFLSCDSLQMAGLCAMWFGYIAETVAVVMLIFHSLMLAGAIPAKIGKPFAGLIWLVLSAGFLIVVLLACGIYTATWTCDNPIVPSVKLSDHFQYNYGFAFAITGFLSSMLILMVTLTLTSTTDGTAVQESPNLIKAICSTLGVITLGCLIAAGCAFAILASNDAWADPLALDPSINPCDGQKQYSSGPGDKYFSNQDCVKDGIAQTLEQAGANVTRGYKGLLDASSRVPITVPYDQTDLCPVNVHWHLGAEHLSAGEFDEHGSGPAAPAGRRLAPAGGYPAQRLGFQCRHYDATDPKFTTEFTWHHCTNMQVGQTYEVHWPHSAAGACGTDWQYQSPFYDGVFCYDSMISIAPLNTYKKIGVQGQIFTIVNDEAYYNGDLIKGMITGGNYAADMAYYTGSTTGTSRDNNVCSRYTPITWQVDRKCHLISASSFDKMCADMKTMKDDMSMDYHPHGARELVADEFVANNQQSRQ